jgi:HEAT repeat protein
MRAILSLLLVLLFSGLVSAQEKKPADNDKAPEKKPEKEKVFEVAGRPFAAWLPELRDRDPSVRRGAIQVLRFFETENEVALKDLIEILEKDDFALRLNAAIALMDLSIKEDNKLASKAIEALTNQLSRSNQINLRQQCALTLARFSTHAQSAIPTLVNVAKDYRNPWDLRFTCVQTFFAVASPTLDEKQVPDLVSTLLDQMRRPECQISARYQCALALGQFGPQAQSAIQTLSFFAQDKGNTWEVRHACVQSLISVGKKDKMVSKEVTAALLNVYKNETAAAIRHDAFMGLATMGTPASPSLRESVMRMLQARLKDKDGVVVVWAYFGLIANDGVKPLYVNPLVDMMKNADVPTRIEALHALFILGREVKSKMPEIVEQLKDKDPAMFGPTCWVLCQLAENVGIPDEAYKILEGFIADKKTPEPKRALSKHTLGVLKGEIDPKTGKEKKKTVSKP